MIMVYVAGSSRNTERARKFRDMVHHWGEIMSLAHDWLPDVMAASDAGRLDNDMSDAERLLASTADLTGVLACDVLVVLAEELQARKSFGSGVELGYAIAMREISAATAAAAGMDMIAGMVLEPAPLILVAGGSRSSIFTVGGTVDHELRTDANTFGALLEIAQARA